MTPEKLFAELLGLGLKWRVTECVFHKDRSQVDLQIEHTDEVWKLERCPQCGHTWRVRPPWEGKAGGFSKEFEAFALLLRKNPENLSAEQAAKTGGVVSLGAAGAQEIWDAL